MLYFKARACFVGELIMPVYSCLWILLLKAFDVTPEYILLNLASDVADADGVGVVSGAVGSDHLEGTALFDGAVESDDEVVAYHLEASLPVPTVDVLHGEVLAFDCG